MLGHDLPSDLCLQTISTFKGPGGRGGKGACAGGEEEEEEECGEGGVEEVVGCGGDEPGGVTTSEDPGEGVVTSEGPDQEPKTN